MEANNPLKQFAASVEIEFTKLSAGLESAKFQMQHRAELAARYNVNQTLWGSDGFLRECARKQVCRNLAA